MLDKVAIIGLGFVGLPMAVALVNSGKFKKIVGIEKSNIPGKEIIKKINLGVLPIVSEDKDLLKNFNRAHKSKNFFVSNNLKEIKECDVILISINFDFYNKKSLTNIKTLFKNIEKNLKSNSLVILETTIPPGFSEKILYPILKANKKKFFYGYSFERVTPGENYYKSIINSTRVFAGIDQTSTNLTRNFLKKVINTKKFPLSEIKSISSCELTKVMENSFRALNIAFIDEWVKFSMINKIDLNAAITEIKKRKTHQNIMRPGLGVGGYCLTKDPFFIKYSSKNLFKTNNKFPFVDLLLKVNKNMEYTSYNYVKSFIHKKNKILILGISYKENVKDLRLSPSIKFKKILEKKGYEVNTHDPYFNKTNIKEFIKQTKADVIIFCVPHKNYQKLPTSFFNKKKNLC